MKEIIVSEQEESAAFSEWLRYKGIKHHHGNDNMYSNSWNQKRKMKEAGFSKGFPDFVCIIPKDLCVEKRSLMLWIEMKRRKGGNVSIEQKEWIAELNKIADQEARVCRGATKAIDFVKEYLI